MCVQIYKQLLCADLEMPMPAGKSTRGYLAEDSSKIQHDLTKQSFWIVFWMLQQWHHNSFILITWNQAIHLSIFYCTCVMFDIRSIFVLFISPDWLIDAIQNVNADLYAKKQTNENKHEHKDNCKECFYFDCFNMIFIDFGNTFHIQHVQHVSLCNIQKIYQNKSIFMFIVVVSVVDYYWNLTKLHLVLDKITNPKHF